MLNLEEYNRDYEEILNEAMRRLQEKTEINNFSSGSIARALLEVYAEPLSNFYDKLTTSLAMKFVTTAEGPFLAEIGKLFNMEKRAGESDDNFRYRIIHATESLAQGNKIAIRLAVLSVDGVMDLRIKKFTRGTGSFDIYLITSDPQNDEATIKEVQDIIEETESFGISGNILKPKIIDVSMNVNIVFYDNVSSDRKNELRKQIKNTISSYISSIVLGRSLVIAEIIGRVMKTDDGQGNNEIKDMNITSMELDGDSVTITNQNFYWDERPIPDKIKVK